MLKEKPGKSGNALSSMNESLVSGIRAKLLRICNKHGWPVE